MILDVENQIKCATFRLLKEIEKIIKLSRRITEKGKGNANFYLVLILFFLFVILPTILFLINIVAYETSGL